jgi:hypothetical protein
MLLTGHSKYGFRVIAAGSLINRDFSRNSHARSTQLINPLLVA